MIKRTGMQTKGLERGITKSRFNSLTNASSSRASRRLASFLVVLHVTEHLFGPNCEVKQSKQRLRRKSRIECQRLS